MVHGRMVPQEIGMDPGEEKNQHMYMEDSSRKARYIKAELHEGLGEWELPGGMKEASGLGQVGLGFVYHVKGFEFYSVRYWISATF